jgi:hypothetical protein
MIRDLRVGNGVAGSRCASRSLTFSLAKHSAAILCGTGSGIAEKKLSESQRRLA